MINAKNPSAMRSAQETEKEYGEAAVRGNQWRY